jgi:hypothetical protein
MRKAPFFIKSDTWALGFGYWTEAPGFEIYLGRWVLCFYDEI